MEKEIVWGNCPRCGPDKRATVQCQVERPNANDLRPTTIFYRLLECGGCAIIYYQRCVEETLVDEDCIPEYRETSTFYPRRSKRERPQWLGELLWYADVDLFNLFDSLYRAFDAELNVLTAIGIRTAFDKSTEVLGVDPSLLFKEKLDQLLMAGHVGKSEYEVLKVLTDAGNAAAHRGWKPKDAEIEIMMSVLESFVFRNCIGVETIKELATKVPARPTRSPGKASSPKAKPGSP